MNYEERGMNDEKTKTRGFSFPHWYSLLGGQGHLPLRDGKHEGKNNCS